MDNHSLALGDGNISSKSEDNNCAQSNSCWGLGESSSSEQLRNASYVGNQISERSHSLENNSSTCASLNLSSNDMDVRENDCQSGVGVGLHQTPNNSICFSTEQIQISNAYSSSSIGTSSENNDPSFGTLGLCGKRKALECTSGHFYPGGSSNSDQPTENIMHGNLSISSGPSSISLTNHVEQLNSRSKVGTSGHHDSVTFGASRGTSTGHSSVNAAQPQSEPVLSSKGKNLMSPMDPEYTYSYPRKDQKEWSAFLRSQARREAYIERVKCRDSLIAKGLQAEAEAMMRCKFDFFGTISGQNFTWLIEPSSSGAGLSSTAWLPHPISRDQQDEAESSSRAERRSDQRSAAAAARLTDMPSDDTNSSNVSAAVEGRHRLIHQDSSAMQRRGVHIQTEGQPRNARLDVDNMSYEELLALQERLGNVSTGLSKEKIVVAMKRRKYEAVRDSTNMEPCCICQEDYVAGDTVGKLDCGHEYHTSCVRRWLRWKNTCPICRMIAFKT